MVTDMALACLPCFDLGSSFVNGSCHVSHDLYKYFLFMSLS